MPEPPRLGCPPPALRPTYLPWLGEGEEVPDPTHVFHPTLDALDDVDPPHGVLIWAADPAVFDPDGYSETDYVAISSGREHEVHDESFPRIDLRGTTATLSWVGDPGIGALGLGWTEGSGDCSGVRMGLLIRDLPDYLGLPEPPDDRVDPDGFEAWSADYDATVEAEIVAIAESLVATDSSGAASSPATCLGDGDARNAPPDDPRALYLYLPCSGDDDLPPALYRHDAATSPTGDVAVDASTLLRELLAGPPGHLADEGFFVPGAAHGIALGPVGLTEPGRLVVDLTFDGGIGAPNASTASITWHTMLAANLLQFAEVTSVELRSDGSCEAYSGLFEGEGCRVLERDVVPWLTP